jgi:hypothetical protein
MNEQVSNNCDPKPGWSKIMVFEDEVQPEMEHWVYFYPGEILTVSRVKGEGQPS